MGRLYFFEGIGVNTREDNMKVLQLRSEDFPLEIRLQLAGGLKQYVLVKTKQDKLLLNKPLENSSNKK
jgi:hypothetical protein